jgi:ribulose bisphosphate carboxylase small subunit
MMSEVNRILGQGYRLAIETIDERRLRTGSWNCYGSYEGDGAISALETCLKEQPRHYIRLVGISSKDRRRMVETIIYRPNSKAATV